VAAPEAAEADVDDDGEWGLRPPRLDRFAEGLFVVALVDDEEEGAVGVVAAGSGGDFFCVDCICVRRAKAAASQPRLAPRSACSTGTGCTGTGPTALSSLATTTCSVLWMCARIRARPGPLLNRLALLLAADDVAAAVEGDLSRLPLPLLTAAAAAADEDGAAASVLDLIGAFP